ncbi:MAG: spore germination protein [Clostridiales bacterium]|jgi:spore germination protein|nr:spore germination protein [Clostridiales bacterium]
MLFLNNKASARQMQMLLMLDIFGAGIVMLPRKAAQYAGNGAWLIVLVMGIAAALIAFLLGTAGKYYREGESFVDAAQRLLSKPVGAALGLLISLKLMFNCVLELSRFGGVVNEKLLRQTPFWVICAVMLAVSSYAASKGYETRARLAQVLFYIVFVPFIFVFVLAMRDVEFENLVPMMSISPGDILKGAAQMGSSLTGLELILLCQPYAAKRVALRSKLIHAVLFIGCVMVFTTIVTYARFGETITQLKYPVLDMMDTTDIPGAFIERQDALMMSFWILSNFAIVNGCMFFSSIVLKDVIKKGRHSIYIAASAVAVFAAVCLLNHEDIDRLIDMVYYTLGAGFLVIVPLIMIISGAARATRKAAMR